MLVGRLCGGSCATSSPSIRISPSLGRSKPAIIRSVVVLPQPLGPSRVKNSPRLRSRLRSSTAASSSKRLVTLAQLDAGALRLWVHPFCSPYLLVFPGRCSHPLPICRHYEHRPVGHVQKPVRGRAQQRPFQRRLAVGCRRRSSARRARRRPRAAPPTPRFATIATSASIPCAAARSRASAGQPLAELLDRLLVFGDLAAPDARRRVAEDDDHLVAEALGELDARGRAPACRSRRSRSRRRSCSSDLVLRGPGRFRRRRFALEEARPGRPRAGAGRTPATCATGSPSGRRRGARKKTAITSGGPIPNQELPDSELAGSESSIPFLTSR